jgi:N-methylhydantoinase A/oxoprolinase/acetone carboxylase beta subunit
MPEQESVLVNARVTVSGMLEELPQEPRLAAGPPAPPIAKRGIYLNGAWTDAAIFDFEALAPEQQITGPAIVESAMTSILLRPGNRATVSEHGWLDIVI